MAKLWMYFKKAMVVWGIIWLLIVLAAGVTIFWETRARHDDIAQAAPGPDVVFKKILADLELSVDRSADGEHLLLNLSRGKQALVTGYALPSGDYGLGGTEIKEASARRLDDGRYRLIMQGSSYDCDQESTHFIWVLDVGQELKLVRMLAVTDLNEVAGRHDRLFARESIQLPEFAEEKFEIIEIPLELEIAGDVTSRVMLGEQNRQLMWSYYSKIITERLAKLTKPEDAVLREKYKAALARLKTDLKG